MRSFFTRPARSLSVFLTTVLLVTTVAQPIAFAARPAVPGLLAGYGLDFPEDQLPQGPQTPQDPLAAALATLPQAQAQPDPQAPWSADPPKPPEARDTLVASVDPATGSLSLSAGDANTPFYDLPFGFARRYSSQDAGTAGPLGYGWASSADQYLRMYVDFNIAEFRGDGSHVSFLFQPANSSQYVDSYDGDYLVYYNLDQGSYRAQSTANRTSLTRQSATDYVVRRPDGTELHYAGYAAPWRTGQAKTAGRLTRMKDAYGNELAFTYSNTGHLTEVADSEGRKLQFAYQGDRLSVVTSPDGGIYHYEYDGAGNLTKVTGPDNRLLSFTYDDHHRLTSRTDGSGVTTRYEYTPDGKVSAVVAAAGRTTYAYDSTARSTAVTDVTGATTTYYFDDKGRNVRTVDALGGETTYTYNDQGLLTAKAAAAGTTQYEYVYIGSKG